MTRLLFDYYVVLMLENRSFDHLFGYLGIGDGIPTGGATNYLKPGDATGEKFTSRKGGDYTAIGEGPSHSLKQTNEQLFGLTVPSASVAAAAPAMNGFVSSFAVSLQHDLRRQPTSSELQQVMNCFDPVQLPVLSTLAKSFVLCDRWFADVPGPTMPNRAFVHAATSQGYTYNADWKPKFTCNTLYDRINADSSRSWRVYSHDQDDVLQLYPNQKSGTTNHSPFASYASDVAGNKLATYSFITPEYIGAPEQLINSMHAPADVRPAEKLIADVYSALREHPDVWKKTLLIVLFDEHGGYYDHVPPPATVSPDSIAGRTDQPFLVPFDFKRLGLRVPAILISPWHKQTIDSTVYSHSTIPGTIIDALQLPGGFLTDRDRQAAKLTKKYLIDDGSHSWREQTPDVTVPMQPLLLDAMQREILDGSVYVDPDPEQQDTKRTRDIRDPAQAKQFVRTQMAKRLEHNLASRGHVGKLPTASAYNELPSPTVSPARIAELRRPAEPPNRRP
jgi:phospholipase C